MIQNNPSLAAIALSTLARWDTHLDPCSKSLRDSWVKIIQEENWTLAIEDSERGNQLRQASPMATLLPNSVRFEIIRKVKKLKDQFYAQG